jgi:uroporphyrinogen III methyltransferase/synthase
LVTRPEGGGEIARRLESLGASVVAVPATRIVPLDPAPLDAALADLAGFHWAIFTSRNAVQVVIERLRAGGRTPSALAALRIAAVGTATAEALHGKGIAVTVVPARFSGDGVLEALRQRSDVAGARVLYAAAAGAADTVPDGLTALGARVERIACYESVADPDAVAPLRAAAGVADVVVLTAPSTLAAWRSAVGDDTARAIPIVSIGQVTSDAIRAVGLVVAAEAAPSTADGLVEAVRRYFSRQ